jgi:hypothetical protein
MSDLRETVVGVWSLVSLRRFKDGIFYRETMGAGATGRIIYNGGGYMCAFLMSADWVAGTARQNWSTFLSYSGKWELDGTTVQHYLDASSVSGIIGTTLERYIDFTPEGDLLLTTDGHVSAEGVKTHDELIWRKVTG